MWKIYAKVLLNIELAMSIMSIAGHSSDSSAEEKTAPEDSPNELHQPIWSVISFERREAAGLVYEEAFRKLEELEARGIAGLCVVTDGAAANVAASEN